MMITWKENVDRYAKVLKEKNGPTVMSILFWELDKINNWKQASIKKYKQRKRQMER